MSAKILDGKETAFLIRKKIKNQVHNWKKAGKRVPGLAVILIGDDPASVIYVGNKHKACEEVGFYSQSFHLDEKTAQNEVDGLIEQLNNDNKIDGILLQSPLPSHLEFSSFLEKIHPTKDVDGFHPYNLGRLAQRRPLLRPCTPYGIIQLLSHYDIPLKGKHVTVVGTSNIVGRPMVLESLLAGATVTNCHRFTQNLEQYIRLSDILIVAIGKRNIIKSEWIKPGCVVVDAGMHRLPNGKVSGDIDFETAKEIASWITPVPGGVGPMTIATLLENTVYAAEHLHS